MFSQSDPLPVTRREVLCLLSNTRRPLGGKSRHSPSQQSAHTCRFLISLCAPRGRPGVKHACSRVARRAPACWSLHSFPLPGVGSRGKTLPLHEVTGAGRGSCTGLAITCVHARDHVCARHGPCMCMPGSANEEHGFWIKTQRRTLTFYTRVWLKLRKITEMLLRFAAENAVCTRLSACSCCSSFPCR